MIKKSITITEENNEKLMRLAAHYNDTVSRTMRRLIDEVHSREFNGLRPPMVIIDDPIDDPNELYILDDGLAEDPTIT